MIELPIYNIKGEQIDTYQLDEARLGGEIRYALLKQAYVRQHANQRQGSARTKGRSDVEGSTRKLYKQKGTGRARMGNVRTNLRKGGGVAFSKTKTREEFRLDMPKKMRRLANRNAILAKAVDQEIKIIDSLTFDTPKTSQFRAILDLVGVNRTCLVALDPSNLNGALSARNIDDVTTIRWQQLNAFEVLNHRFLVIDRESLDAFVNERYLGAVGANGSEGHSAGGEASNGSATTAARTKKTTTKKTTKKSSTKTAGSASASAGGKSGAKKKKTTTKKKKSGSAKTSGKGAR